MKSLRKEMILSYLLIVILCELFIALPVTMLEMGNVKGNVTSRALISIDHLTTSMEAKIDISKTLVRTASIYVETHEVEKEETENYFEYIMKEETGYSNIYFGNFIPVNEEGGQYFTSSHWVADPSYNQTGRDWFVGAMKLGYNDFCIIDPYKDALTDGVCATISRQTKGGVIGIDITLDDLNNFVVSTIFSKNGSSFLLNRDGLIVASSNPDIQGNFFEIYPQLSENKEVFLGGEAVIDMGQKKGTYMIGRSISDEAGWFFVSVGPRRELYGSLYRSILALIIMSLIAIIVSIAIGFMLSSNITGPIKKVAGEVKKIASGNADLTNRLSVKSKNEIGDLVDGFNEFMMKLQEIVSQLKGTKQILVEAEDDLQKNISGVSDSIRDFNGSISLISSKVDTQVGNVQQTSSTIAEITENISSLKRMIEGQSSGISEASSAVEEMIGNISSVNQSMEKMASSFKELEKGSETGMLRQKKVTELVDEIAKQSESLKSANIAIADVAAQTSLLAMNAAIEAAHAGEAGKGFSVVADEIRKLSESSSEQSKKISNDIKDIQETINSVVESSRLSADSFNQVQEQIDQTDILVEQVHSAMQEQEEGSTQVLSTLKMMNDSTTEVRTASDEMTEGSNIMLEEIKKLQDATAEIKDTMGEMSGSAQAMNKTNDALSAIAGNVGGSINEMSGQLDQFKA